MNITFKPADNSDIETVYLLSKDLIDRYENIENINYDMVLNWIKDKINKSINEYASVYLDDKKCGYYHFCRNEEGILEIDDLYIFKEYQNKGIGTYVINNILITINKAINRKSDNTKTKININPLIILHHLNNRYFRA